MSIQKIGVVWNGSKTTGLDAVRRILRMLDNRRISYSLNEDLALVTGESAFQDAVDFADCDVLAVFGGDGTILRALDCAIPNDLPILGVNLGRLGFLSEIEIDRAEEDFQRVLAGDYTIDERMLMGVDGYADDRHFALNDVVIERSGPQTGMLSLEYAVDGGLVNRFAADGLILSSATGSTAYSLSAGGPIIAPGLDCFVLTPICPHLLNVQPVVVSADRQIRVRVTDDRGSACVLLDGRNPIPMGNGEITVRRSTRSARFIRLHDRNFFDLLRGKLSEWTH